MTPDWTQLEGATLAGRYWLKQCLGATVDDAWFLTRFGTSGDAAVRVLRADAADAAAQLEVWRALRGLEHPHIVRVLDAGEAETGGAALVYLVCEYPDEFLAAALGVRLLAPAEARQVLTACAAALSFLHGKNLVHAAVDPEHIVSIRETIKLSPETIRRAKSGAGETATAVAADLQSLGATAAELMTGRRPGPDHAVPDLPQPFADIVAHTCGAASPWPLAQIQAALNPPEPAPLPAPAASEEQAPPLVPAEPSVAFASRPAVSAPSVRRLGLPIKWVPAVGLVAAVLLSLAMWRHPKPAAPPAPPVTAPTPAPVRAPAPAIPAHRAAPPPVPSNADPSAIWRVVAYQYATRAGAEREARRIDARHPEWRAQVFAPGGKHGPYFVALGGRMTRDEAERLRSMARARGLPRDTFVRNFSE